MFFFINLTYCLLLQSFFWLDLIIYQVCFGLQFSQGLSKNCMQRDGTLYLGIKFTFKANCSKKLLAL